jgi:hypothetical protein
LYDRAFAYIREHPGDFLALEVKKIWLTLGNDELTQDYDWHGEAEILPWVWWVSLPFGVLLALGALGLWRLRRMSEHIPWLWVLGGQLTAVGVANVVFFTSAQHRLPLVVPLAWVSGLALVDLWEHRGRRRRAMVVAGLIMAQAFWPRSSKAAPSAIHYYNLAVVRADAGQLTGALTDISRAAVIRPDHPLIRLERARLLSRAEHWDEAESELDWLEVLPGASDRVVHDVAMLRISVRQGRADAALRESAGP